MPGLIIEKETNDLKKKENLELWQTRIKNHLEWISSHWNGWASWRAAYLLDRAIHWGKAEAIKDKSQDLTDKVSIPIIANHIRNLMPFLFSRDPVFYGTSIKKEEQDIENTAAQLDYLNWVWGESKISEQARKSILDAAIIGHGIIKTGWGIDLDLSKTTNPAKQGEINYIDYIKKEYPYARRVNPFMFLFQRTSPDSDLASARWCAELIITSVQDLLDNNLYNEKVRNKIADGSVPITKVREFSTKYETESENSPLFAVRKEEEEVSPDELCILYKFYDRKFGNVFTLLPGYSEQPLAITPWGSLYSQLKNFPFIKVDFEEVPNEVYGIGHARYLADTQHQVNRNRSKIYGITRMFNPKYIHKGGKALDPGAQEKIQSDTPGEVVHIGQDESLDEFPTPKASSDLYSAASLLDKDFSELSGDDVLSRGGLLPSRTSAEEIRERRRLRGLRLETNVDNTHRFVLEIGDHILAHAKRFASKELVINVIGRPGTFWNTISPKALKDGETRLKLEVISKDPNPPEVVRRNLLELFSIISNPNVYQMLQGQGIQVNLKRLWRKLMETYGIDELQHVFPGLNENVGLPNINLANIGNTPNMSNGSNNGVQSQSANFDPNSSAQGLEGIFSMLNQGQINPQAY